jgi:cytochrome c peroxidase
MIKIVRASLLSWCCASLAFAQPPVVPATGAAAAGEISAQAAIGWKLFFDKRLSRDESFACSSCHDPEKGYTDGLRFSSGVHGDLLNRNTPTVANLANATQLFWDGRADSLEHQAEGPMTNPLEMDFTLEEISARVAAAPEYLTAFAAIGVTAPTITDVTAALAAFERTLVTGETAYDRWLQGDKDALDKSQSNGRFLFFTRGQCAICHIPPDFTDHKFHNVGTGTDADPGRFAVTGDEKDAGVFKTPSLRNWRGTEPFMHDGRFATMEEVIAFYSEPPEPEVGKSELDPLGFSARDKRDLLAFMDALNGAWPDLSRYEAVWTSLQQP